MRRRLLYTSAGICLASSVLAARPAAAQTAPVAPPPFGVLDNSFLIEEAFNQERGVVQSLFSFHRQGREWTGVFTQEWPAPNLRHQLSYTLPFGGTEVGTGLEDVLLNYRFQALEEGPGRPAFAPRLSVILPSGRSNLGLGGGVTAWQVGLPFSKRSGNFYFHWNLGVTYHPAQIDGGLGTAPSATDTLVGGSTVWRASSTFNLLLEALVESIETPSPDATSRDTLVTLSPGMRKAWNLGDQQAVIGLAVPISRGPDGTRAGVLGYFSYELPFKR